MDSSVASETLVFLFAVAAFFASFQLKLAYRAKKRVDEIEGTPTTPIGKLVEGRFEVKGVVDEHEEEDLLVSPLTKKKCVYYQLVLEQVKGREYNRQSAAWVPIIDDSDYIVFSVSDGTGQVYVDVAGAELNLEPDKKVASGGLFTNPPPELEKYLNSRSMSAKGLFTGSKSFKCRETVLEPGDNLYVLGRVIRDDDNALSFYRSDDLYYISDSDEDELLAKLKGQMRRHIQYTALIFGCAAVLYFFITKGL